MTLKTQEQRAKHKRKVEKNSLAKLNRRATTEGNRQFRSKNPMNHVKAARRMDVEEVTPAVQAARDNLQTEVIDRGPEITDLLAKLKAKK